MHLQRLATAATVAIAALALAAATGARPAAGTVPPLRSGVAGEVLSRRAGMQCFRAPCGVPVPGLTVTFTRGERVVRARSDRAGRFRLALPPGAWVARAPGLLSVLDGYVVRVRPGRYTPLVLFVRGRGQARLQLT
jgi:hypothetical protein